MIESDIEPDNLEIERKWLVESLPNDLDLYPNQKVKQGYIVITENATEVRLRKQGYDYFLTVKTGAGKIRNQPETKLYHEQFDKLWAATEGRRIDEKTRYLIPYLGYTIELDVYSGNLTGLVTAEVEFKTVEESEQFIVPDWFDKEITDNHSYKNQSLALYGRPTPEYNLDDGIPQLLKFIKYRLTDRVLPFIVAVAGGSASGKTSKVAAKLKECLGDNAEVLSMDNYYKGNTFIAKELEKGNKLNWDHPETVNFTLIRKHLSQLSTGTPIQTPVYSFKTGEPTGETTEVTPKKVIILEGIFALDDSIKDECDLKVFVDIGTHGRLLRRLLRDIQRTTQEPGEILDYFAGVVEPMHDKYVQNTRKNADVVILNEYNPEIEAGLSGLHEVQLKFKGEPNLELLRKLGTERLGEVKQSDTYYHPRDRNLNNTGEVLRIRREGEQRILTYKGPMIDSEFRERPKLEFEIDEQTERKFLTLYGKGVRVIDKLRTLYQLDGLVFTSEFVYKTVGGHTTPLGNFIEIRSVINDGNQPNFLSLLSKLELDINTGIKKSYADM